MKLLGSVSLTLIAAAVTGSSVCAQQNWMNRMYNFSATWAGYVFGGSTATGGIALDSIYSRELMDWGIDSAVSATDQNISGFRYVLQDQDPGTTHTYSVVAYSEDPNLPNNPDVAGGAILTAGPFTSPQGTAGTPAAWIFTLTGLNSQMPREKDVFVGVELPAVTVSGDILLMQFIDADTTHPSSIYTQPGQSYSLVPNGTHLMGIDTSTGLIGYHNAAGSQIIDVQIFGPGATALTNSNEAPNPATANGPITTPCTAFYPDAVNFNATGRTDSIGVLYQDDEFAITGGFVGIVFGVSLNPLNASAAGGPFPISNVYRGQGNLCTDIITGSPDATLFFGPTTVGAGGEQYFERTVTVPVSVVTAGVTAVWQGITYDGATGRLRSSGCVVQTL